MTSHPTGDRNKDTGMALCLLCFLLGASLGIRSLEWVAMALLVVTMTSPGALKPAAVVWFWFSAAVGAVTSRLLFTALFVLVVTPVGIVRRWMGYDSMGMKRWKRNRDSTFQVRNHTYAAEDLEQPY